MLPEEGRRLGGVVLGMWWGRKVIVAGVRFMLADLGFKVFPSPTSYYLFLFLFYYTPQSFIFLLFYCIFVHRSMTGGSGFLGLVTFVILYAVMTLTYLVAFGCVS